MCSQALGISNNKLYNIKKHRLLDTRIKSNPKSRIVINWLDDLAAAYEIMPNSDKVIYYNINHYHY